jgi:hypothetical protein
MLKKGDKVVIHTCGEAEHYNGKIWTCKTDEFVSGNGIYQQDVIFLEGFSGSFVTKYLQKVNVDEEVERFKKYVLYFAGKDKLNDIRIAMEERELD